MSNERLGTDESSPVAVHAEPMRSAMRWFTLTRNLDDVPELDEQTDVASYLATRGLEGSSVSALIGHLSVTRRNFARALQLAERTLRSWESNGVNGGEAFAFFRIARFIEDVALTLGEGDDRAAGYVGYRVNELLAHFQGMSVDTQYRNLTEIRDRMDRNRSRLNAAIDHLNAGPFTLPPGLSIATWSLESPLDGQSQGTAITTVMLEHKQRRYTSAIRLPVMAIDDFEPIERDAFDAVAKELATLRRQARVLV